MKLTEKQQLELTQERKSRCNILEKYSKEFFEEHYDFNEFSPDYWGRYKIEHEVIQNIFNKAKKAISDKNRNLFKVLMKEAKDTIKEFDEMKKQDSEICKKIAENYGGVA